MDAVLDGAEIHQGAQRRQLADRNTLDPFGEGGREAATRRTGSGSDRPQTCPRARV